MMFQSKLPADPTALVLGIVSLVVLVLGCCCGVGSIIALVLSIVGLSMARKSLKLYEATPEVYSSKTRETVSAANIVCIVGVVLSAIVTVFFVIYFIIVGTLASDEIWRELKQHKSEREPYARDTVYKREADTTYVDSTYQDSIIVEEVK